MTPRVILWDWNGTLLDDLRYAIGVRNRVFPRFGLPGVADIQTYYEQFTFPVRLYYERAGVTEGNFVQVANAWMDEYLANCHTVPLFDDALFALDSFQDAGCMQIVLSASKEDNLKQQLENAGILDRFAAVLGLSHIYATDKTDLARAWLLETNTDPTDCVLLGDTTHDADVADSLGMGCVLIARGHMSRNRLLLTGHPVCDSLTQATALVLGRKPETV
ncbi:MAG TPA: HAD hydrolase-like protein [Candidatus Limiplasma sp.]|nr:HAD hydrolase-like protein [Candidatus Limiplasma sp.]